MSKSNTETVTFKVGDIVRFKQSGPGYDHLKSFFGDEEVEKYYTVKKIVGRSLLLEELSCGYFNMDLFELPEELFK